MAALIELVHKNDLFPETILFRLAQRGHVSGDLRKCTYGIEATPHRSQRILFFDQTGRPFAVGKWADGRYRARLAENTGIIQRLAEFQELRPMLPEILLLETIGSRIVVVYRWQTGDTLQSRLSRLAPPQTWLDDPFRALTCLQSTTGRVKTFSEDDHRIHVVSAVDLLQRLADLDAQDQFRLASVAESLKILINQDMLFSVVHGDFEFCNLLRSDDGGIRILDWELSQPMGIGFQDAAHLLIAYGVDVLGMSYSDSVLAIFLPDGLLSHISQTYLASYGMVIPVNSSLTRPLVALTVLTDAAEYIRRLPLLTDRSLWSSYISAAAILTSINM